MRVAPPEGSAEVAIDEGLMWADACAQAEMVRRGEVSPGELVDAAIARIEGRNPAVNAVIHTRFDRARSEAAGPLPDGPFRGVPVLVKDLGASAAGDPRWDGTRFLQSVGFVADHDTAVVARLRRAGFVMVGRTNTPEMGSTITTEPISTGPTRNPWDTSRSSGGSSGGSGAAVAAGMTAVAHASDGGGSIRIPASHNALVGLKPARGRVSRAPDRGEGWMGGSTDGALTRTVRDAAAVLDVLAGPEPGDPYAAPPLPGPLLAEVGRDPGRLRVGVLDHPPVAGVAADADADAARAVQRAAALLESLGHHVEDAHPVALEEGEANDRFVNVVAVGIASDLADWERRLGRPVTDDELEPDNVWLRQAGRAIAAPDYVATVNWLHAWTRRVAAWWADEGFDLLVCPVLNGPPPPLGWLRDPDEGLARLGQLMRYTSQWNMTGQPAVSLPLHWTPGGLPMGVQVVAGAGREDRLVRVAAQVEAAAPWAERRPSVDGA